MILDRQNLVSQAQDISGAVGSVVSTDTIDLLVNRDVAEGATVEFTFTVTTGVTGASSLVEFQIILADDAALTSNVEVIGSSGAIAQTALPIGTRVAVKANSRPSGLGRRYLGARYVRSGATVSAGAVTGGYALATDSIRKQYPNGYDIV